MIVSDSHRFIYARVPKTGSTSVSTALEPFRRREDAALAGKIMRRLPGMRETPRATDFRAHAHWPLLAAKTVLGAGAFEAYFRFTVVRHPVARMLSYFRHIQRQGHDDAFRREFPEIIVDGVDFDRFAESLAERPLPSQAATILDEDGKPIANTVVRIERLHDEIDGIFATLGIAVEIPRLNRATQSETIAPSRAAHSAIERAFAVDYEQLGYDEEGVSGAPDLRRTDLTAIEGKRLAVIGATRFRPWRRLPTDA